MKRDIKTERETGRGINAGEETGRGIKAGEETGRGACRTYPMFSSDPPPTPLLSLVVCIRPLSHLMRIQKASSTYLHTRAREHTHTHRQTHSTCPTRHAQHPSKSNVSENVDKTDAQCRGSTSLLGKMLRIFGPFEEALTVTLDALEMKKMSLADGKTSSTAAADAELARYLAAAGTAHSKLGCLFLPNCAFCPSHSVCALSLTLC